MTSESSEQQRASFAQQTGKFFSHPYMVALAWAATVFSLGWNVYEHYAGEQRPQLTYAVQPVNTAVVHAGESSKLTVSYEGKPITGDVSSAQVAFWNAGNLTIHGALKPLRIYTEPQTPILEARIRNPGRDVTGLRLDSSEQDKGVVIVRWDLLEHNDGGIVQIVFAGGVDTNVVASAVVEGQASIRPATTPARDLSNLAKFVRAAGAILIAGFLSTLGVAIDSIIDAKMPAWRLFATRSRGTRLAARILIWLLALVLPIWLLVVLLRHFFVGPTPPFAF
jgi:hypothetical protein